MLLRFVLLNRFTFYIKFSKTRREQSRVICQTSMNDQSLEQRPRSLLFETMTISSCPMSKSKLPQVWPLDESMTRSSGSVSCNTWLCGSVPTSMSGSALSPHYIIQCLCVSDIGLQLLPTVVWQNNTEYIRARFALAMCEST